MKIITLILLAMATMVHAENKLQTDLPLKYLVAEPKVVHSSVQSRPLVIFLHGYGSNEEDLFELKQEFSPDYTYLSVQAPMMLAPGSYQWYGLQPHEQSIAEATVKKHLKMLEDFIKAATVKYHTEADKVLLVGFSQGGMMAYELALNNPKMVRGIASLSGKILPALKTKMKPGLNLSGLAVFIGHGTGDDRVPLREATEANALLEKTSIKPTFHTYPKMGHSINQQELDDIKKWMETTLSIKR
jgi:phospholipase/carboxylesterase